MFDKFGNKFLESITVLCDRISFQKIIDTYIPSNNNYSSHYTWGN